MNYAFLTFITKYLRFEFVTANILTTYEKKKEKTIPYHFKLSVSNVARIIIDATVCFQSYYLPIPFGEWNLPCITILIQRVRGRAWIKKNSHLCGCLEP